MERPGRAMTDRRTEKSELRAAFCGSMGYPEKADSAAAGPASDYALSIGSDGAGVN
jgi:hypothetical protein